MRKFKTIKTRKQQTAEKPKATEQMKAGMVDKLKLPRDLIFGAVILTITGQNEAYIENYRGIIEYNDSKIRLQTKTCQVELIGLGLQIIYYTNDEMKITGQIHDVHYT